MKRFLFCLMAALAFVGCTDEGPDDGGSTGGGSTQPQTTITLTTTALNFATEGGSQNVTFTTLGEWTVQLLPKCDSVWCKVAPVSGAAGSTQITVTVSANETTSERSASLNLKSGTAQKTIRIRQNPTDLQVLLNLERQTMIDLYNATDGDNWTNNTNWCSDKPVSEWYGIKCTTKGFIQSITLRRNNLVGSIPESIGNLKSLTGLYFEYNKLSGTIPESIGNCQSLVAINFSGNELSGSIPVSLGNVSSLRDLKLTSNKLTGNIPESLGNVPRLYIISLAGNELTGSIPDSFANLSELYWLDLEGCKLTGSIPAFLANFPKLEAPLLHGNGFSGEIPQAVMQASWWPQFWFYIVNQNPNLGGGFDEDDLIIYAPKFSCIDINNKPIDNSIFGKNKYTILYHHFEDCAISAKFNVELINMYKSYKDKGLEVLSTIIGGSLVDLCKPYAEEHNLPWIVLANSFNYIDGMESYNFLHNRTRWSPAVSVFDQEGKLVFNQLYRSYTELADFLAEKLGEVEVYESTDYSQDGVVTTLQTATKGAGIDVVLMGDAYSDRLIADGTYDKTMNTAMEKFFAVEPYKSYRDHFNVYSVKAVSKNEGYDDGYETVFSGEFGEGTHVGGDHSKVIEYGLKAIGDERMNEAMLVVMMNSLAYAGTCYMYQPSATGDAGSGLSISYFPIGVDDTALEQVLNHETNGHGFAKLADEYAYEANGVIPYESVTSTQTQQTDWGWWKNVDFVSDVTAVRWAKFISDSRYANEKLGAYEGAMTYWSGVWRPTENSIMRYNTGGFNAPSREAIYYRIHKLAYGDEWTYDYETFVKYDEINRTTITTTQSAGHPMIYKPTAPPVVMKKNWKDELR